HHGRTARPDSKPSGPERAAASRSPHRRETPHRPRAGLQSPDPAPPREWIDPAPARGDCLAFEAILCCPGLCSLKPRMPVAVSPTHDEFSAVVRTVPTRPMQYVQAENIRLAPVPRGTP